MAKKGNTNTRTVQEPVVKTRKVSAVRVRSIHDARSFFSKKETPSLIELSESQLIEEGYRYPYAIRPNFKKTVEEREELAKVKFKAPRKPGVPTKKDFSIPKLYTIQIKYVGPGKIKNFKTTYSAWLKESEIFSYEASLKFPELTVIAKKVYGGKITWQNEKLQSLSK